MWHIQVEKGSLHEHVFVETLNIKTVKFWSTIFSSVITQNIFLDIWKTKLTLQVKTAGAWKISILIFLIYFIPYLIESITYLNIRQFITLHLLLLGILYLFLFFVFVLVSVSVPTEKCRKCKFTHTVSPV